MAAKPVVLHVIESLGIGGTEKLLTGYINELKSFTNIVVALNEPLDLASEIRDAEVICFYDRRKINFFKATARLREIIESRNVQLVHSHLFYATLVARRATPRNVKLLFSVHSPLGIDAFRGNAKARLAELLTVRSQHALLAVSHSVLNDYNQHIRFKGKQQVVYNFVPDKFWDEEPRVVWRHGQQMPLRCIVVANLKPVKNIFGILNALKSLKGQHIEVDIYGEGNMRTKLQSFIDENNLPVQLKGTAANVEKLLTQYHLFISASLFEGFGLAVVEAMAMRVPLLLSAIPGHKELAGDHAIYFDPEKPETLAAQLLLIVNGMTELGKFSKEGYERAKKIGDRSQYIQQLSSLYESILNSKS